ncbi:TetR/AcrR family transcriptional regulator [Acuticoccus sp. MNP-M23]|uniref:TetR/AcrR family transcriptional regulator n=1 Tax=Acuticoccus sp. MNP-M23 TaxID=3072793 RepID=UPI00281605AE|nr:TetR/AcrR family transcriptional regulator [Acuticoccus sp. MNP-M23]WMS44637.1 TetR/AcrR family transcriptional regulator [Acuticoccus sp. MNP-M23]
MAATKTPGRRLGRPPRDGRSGTDDVKATLLAVASQEFAAEGFAGARVNRICALSNTNVRMLYHYFGSKDGLYEKTLEHALGQLRAAELDVKVEGAEPFEALLLLFDFIHAHFDANPTLIRLLSAENLNKARHLKTMEAIPQMSSPVAERVRRLVTRGQASGSVRQSIEPLRLYVMMVALSYFHLSNVHTLSAIFDEDLSREPWRRQQHADARGMVAAYLTPERTDP